MTAMCVVAALVIVGAGLSVVHVIFLLAKGEDE